MATAGLYEWYIMEEGEHPPKWGGGETNLYPLNHDERAPTEEMMSKESEAWVKDILWMADITTDDDHTTPMWVGWNSQLLSFLPASD